MVAILGSRSWTKLYCYHSADTYRHTVDETNNCCGKGLEESPVKRDCCLERDVDCNLLEEKADLYEAKAFD